MMQMAGQSIVITGAASGIGRAMALRFARERPRGLVLVDLPRQEQALRDLGALIERGEGPGHPSSPVMVAVGDVGREADIQRAVAAADAAFGHVDVFCSNAGIYRPGDEALPDEAWRDIWQVNVMSHVYAARAVVPGMRLRGSGYLLNTISASGITTAVRSANYAVTKHAALAFAEWLSIEHGPAGVRVSAICPRNVDTPMIAAARKSGSPAAGSLLSADDVADCVVEGMKTEAFLILPHPEVLSFLQEKAANYDGWIARMRIGSAASAKQ
jgi:NAD(P)-dependent dehydrogenase (short-subunit alcohol dehydrogenase family)